MANYGQVVLNAFELLRPERIELARRIYRVVRQDGGRVQFEEHSAAISALWDLRRSQRQHFTSGGGAPSSAAHDKLALPTGWKIPDGPLGQDYALEFLSERLVSAANAEDERILLPLMSKAINKRLKDSPGDLGDMWSNFGRPTQMPNFSNSQRGQPVLCRSFDLQFRRFAGGRVFLTIWLHTCPIDPWSISQYYRQGAVDELAEILESKRDRRTKRDGRPLEIRAWCALADGGADVVTLDEPEKMIRDGALEKPDQQRMPEILVAGHLFMKPRTDYSATSLHLILDTEDAGEFHADTILSPGDRIELMQKARDALTPTMFEDLELELSEEPVSCEAFGGGVVSPQPITIRTGKGKKVLDIGTSPSTGQIRDRARTRARASLQDGFVVADSVVPILAIPARKKFDAARTKCLAVEMDRILTECGCSARFIPISFDKVDEIDAAVKQHRATGALVVLPEHSKDPYGDDNTHERVKRKLSVPSQCLHWDHTQHPSTIGRSLAELEKGGDDRDRRSARRIRQMYEICVSGLLVKLGNIPFAPAAPYHYNVHIGLDVGGVHNNVVVASMAYGLANPNKSIFFRVERIEVPISKVEPIPVDFLVRGLRDLFASAKADLEDAGMKADFESVLIFRDGRLLGVDGRWNELDALKAVREEFVREGTCTNSSHWAAVEVSKLAQGLKLFALTPTPDNVVVGTWKRLYEDPNSALVVTTGRPYLTQGTAEPAKLTLVPIAGAADMAAVIQDYVWDADMSFTKPDMSLSLPWTLKIADQGALDFSRTYKVTGITAS